ncbi:hypothetical protein PAXRUDRAFT_21295 [Paxillus rubicundulus Ve08.2h10]|uniref:Uncharacterized protein n=1 Tax=Paxillus rubicundulus Ve08.2h10 TaxID=930991 RepID=A0A0D0CZW0_9AGAM|nr:hypothetical protein PAXRUDRAFT_21295 [Paxillus rubicundulus Ve08.2h10]
MALPTALRLALPMNAVTLLLPESTLSILNFLKFPLPPPGILSKPYPPPSMYFSSIPTPPPDIASDRGDHILG